MSEDFMKYYVAGRIYRNYSYPYLFVHPLFQQTKKANLHTLINSYMQK